MPLNLVQWRCLLDDLSLAFETVLLLSEAGFQNGIGRKYDVVFNDLLCICVPVTTVPDEDLQAFSVRFDLVLPLHYGDSRAKASELQRGCTGTGHKHAHAMTRLGRPWSETKRDII